MLKILKVKAELSKVVIKNKINEIAKDEKGGVSIPGLVILGILLLAVLASSTTLTSFVTDLTTDVTSFFSTKVNGMLN